MMTRNIQQLTLARDRKCKDEAGKPTRKLTATKQNEIKTQKESNQTRTDQKFYYWNDITACRSRYNRCRFLLLCVSCFFLGEWVNLTRTLKTNKCTLYPQV